MDCPACKNPKALILFTTVECPNSVCQNFVMPEIDAPAELTKLLDEYYKAMDKMWGPGMGFGNGGGTP